MFQRSSNPSRTRRLRAAAALVLFLGGAAAAVWWYQIPTSDELLEQARQALEAGDYERAERLAVRVGPQAAEFVDARLIAGEAATRLDRYEQAISYYTAVPDDGSEAGTAALYCTGDLWFHLGEASRAVECYRRALARQPLDRWSHEQLANVLGYFDNRWESVPHLLKLVQLDAATVEHLLYLGDVDAAVESPAGISKFRTRAPEDPLPLTALAKSAWRDGSLQEAETLARQAVRLGPELSEAWAILARVLLDRGSDEFVSWHAQLPRSAEVHPEVWIARGAWARRRHELRVAARCFWEAVRRHPDSRKANYQLGQVLVQLGESESASPFLRRAARLEELKDALTVIYRNQGSVTHLRKAAGLTESLGRLWESRAWYRVMLHVNPAVGSVRDRLRSLEVRLSPEVPRTLAAANPALHADLSHYPLPDWKSAQPIPDRRRYGPSPEVSVRFEDRAKASGLEFQYFNGAVPPEQGKLVFQSLGGGTAAVDYDGDHWPDLYFGQGREWPPDRELSRHVNRLYRNLGNGRFEDVTALAGLGDTSYTHGLAVGDIDNDGFPDVYVANSGRNRLYQNNGDGTFSDITDDAGLDGEQCTVSCVVADVNGDSHPDLYDVNYLAAPDVYTLVCQRRGRPHACSPRQIAAEPDRILVNLGDGRFEDVSSAAGLDLPHGKGLGILAADFSGSGNLSLFVANDTDANYLLSGEGGMRGEIPVFRDLALSSGVAFDADGAAQACMGVAAGDADGDGRLDLFVTNFYKESNTLYRQVEDRLFRDVTGQSGLHGPSLPELGFGTQFLDGELDGWLDLVVANGHVDDERDEGTPYQMRPQYFRNLGAGRFEEMRSSPPGVYFTGAYLGRALARLDWNRDGREDFVVTHLDAPAALLTNQTGGAGHHLAVKLVGTDGSRDAIGARVSVKCGQTSLTHFLTAGDGYMAANQKLLIFGVGRELQVQTLEVLWPSGRRQVVKEPPINRELVLVEGSSRFHLLPSPEPAAK